MILRKIQRIELIIYIEISKILIAIIWVNIFIYVIPIFQVHVSYSDGHPMGEEELEGAFLTISFGSTSVRYKETSFLEDQKDFLKEKYPRYPINVYQSSRIKYFFINIYDNLSSVPPLFAAFIHQRLNFITSPFHRIAYTELD